MAVIVAPKILIQAPLIAPVNQHFTCSSFECRVIQDDTFKICVMFFGWFLRGLFPWCVSMCCPAVGHQCHHGVPVQRSVLIYRAVSSFTHAKCQDPKIYSGVSPRGNRDDCALFQLSVLLPLHFITVCVCNKVNRTQRDLYSKYR